MTDAAQRAAQLRALLQRANDLYFNQDAPEIADAEYDRLLDELVGLESRQPELITADSPTQTIGGQPKSSFPAVEHVEPMLSLDKIHEDPPDAEERKGRKQLELFFGRCMKEAGSRACLAMPKLDGLAISLTYIDGRLKVGATRGDGRRGENITPNIRLVRGVPYLLEGQRGTLTVRGEALISHAGFASTNQQQREAGKPEFVNPRNATAGTLRQLEAQLVAQRQVEFIAYSALGAAVPATASASFAFLKQLGFQVADPSELVDDAESFERYAAKIRTYREDSPYGIDGIVLRLDDIAAGAAMGTTAKAPRAMAAFKFLAERALTRLEGIDWQLGRTGVLTPVARLRPVKVGDVTVSSATLHNYAFFTSKTKDEKKKQLLANEESPRHGDWRLRLGDWVELIRSGEVIPKIELMLTDRRTGEERLPQLPSKCPTCGSELRRDSVNLVCTGSACPGVKLATLRYFVSRPVMDMDGLAEKTLEKMIRHNVVSEPADLFALKDKDFIQLLQLERGDDDTPPPAAAAPPSFALDESESPRAQIDAIAQEARRLITAVDNDGADNKEAQRQAAAIAAAAQDAFKAATASARAAAATDAALAKKLPGIVKRAAEQSKSIAAKAAQKTRSLKNKVQERSASDAESARRQLAIIDRARSTTLARVLASLAIPGLGRTVAESLAQTPEPEEFLKKGDAAALCFVDAVDYETAVRIKKFFQPPASASQDLFAEGEAEAARYVSRDHIAKLRRRGVAWDTPQVQPRSRPFAAVLEHVNYLNGVVKDPEPWPRQSGVLVAKLAEHDVKSIEEILERELPAQLMRTADAAKAVDTLQKLARSKEYKRLLAQLDKYAGVTWTTTKQERQGTLAGKKVLVTGRLEGYTREQARELVLKHGGTPVSGVTKQTDLVVLGAEPGATKVKKAEALGIETVAAEAFLRDLGANGGL